MLPGNESDAAGLLDAYLTKAACKDLAPCSGTG